MSDLISRQALCDDLQVYKVYPVPIFSDESEIKGYNDGIDLAISVITKFPSTEPEQKKGSLKTGSLKTVGFLTCQCSECGVQFHELEYTNYCPNCGTKWGE